MNKLISALLIGGVFGLGIALSGMANPAKVLNFFDIAGTWDPSLLVVMASALTVTAIGYRLVFGSQPKPVFDTRFDVPTNKSIDWQLVGGSVVFGIGWGVTGFCPGGAIPALGLGNTEAPIFVAAMAAGIAAAKLLKFRAANASAARA
ncbi:MAG: YeeE/YedE family protein [Rhizobiaceae bacterium]|nr:YeeE/YedE family protein [Rhizobiaceae bacterium]